MLNLDLLQVLREKLLHDKELSPIWTYFLDHFGDHDEFHRLCKPGRNPLVEASLAAMGLQVFGRKMNIPDLVLVRLPAHEFLHGSFSIGNRIGGVLYFEKDHLGLAAMTQIMPPGDTKFARFSGHVVNQSREPSVN